MRALSLCAVLAGGCIPYVDFGPECLSTRSCPDGGDGGEVAAEGGAADIGGEVDAPSADAGMDVAADAEDAGVDVAAGPEAAVGKDVAVMKEAGVDAPREMTCGAGLRACGEACVNTLDDVSHCGACGRACRGDQACAGGTCECVSGRVDCGGACRNLQSDAAHCGRCDNACPSGLCLAGACACAAGQVECAGACRTLATDAMHCGRCGNACRSGECAAGACAAEQRSCRATGTPGCGLVEVAGGTFTMGTSIDCSAPMTDPRLCGARSFPAQGNVAVDAFAIDAYEVTVARFREFWLARMADGGASLRARPVAYPGGRIVEWMVAGEEPSPIDLQCNWSVAAGSARGAHPINCVTWPTAMEFCVWDGGRLPTEAEWEFAARGRVVVAESLATGRPFPWGEETASACARAHTSGCRGEDGALTLRGGSFAASGGVYDLAGNVEEWMADRFEDYTNAECWARFGATNPLCMPRLASGSTNIAVRGGSWIGGDVRAASRSPGGSSVRQGYTGFRCARSR